MTEVQTFKYKGIKQALTVLNPYYSSEDFEKMGKYVFKIYHDSKGRFPL